MAKKGKAAAATTEQGVSSPQGSTHSRKRNGEKEGRLPAGTADLGGCRLGAAALRGDRA
uniref:Uncharacterized protein n=1 Tax=Arundo donax TaxID=35708 RepID=A0A0A8Y3X2_ARUDO